MNSYSMLRSALIVVLSVGLLLLAACERKADKPVVVPNGLSSTATTKPRTTPTLRVVSLAPAITQIMVDLGKSAMLVGISENDDAAPAGLPIVGNFVDINTEALLATKPTHVLMMVGKGGAPARLKEMAAAGRFKLVAYAYPDKISDVISIIAGEPTLPANGELDLGHVLGCVDEATAAASKMTRQLLAIRELTKDQPGKRRVLIVIGSNPVMASGNNTVLNELLLASSGENVASGERVSAPTFDREKINALAPDVVVVVMPGAPPLKPLAEESRLAELNGLDIPAVREKRIVLINDQLALLPATNLGRIGGLMAKAVWPELSDKVDQAMRAHGGDAVVKPPPASTAPATRPAGEISGE